MIVTPDQGAASPASSASGPGPAAGAAGPPEPRRGLSWVLRRFFAHLSDRQAFTVSPTAPQLPAGEDRLDRFLFGLAQPLLALRRLCTDWRLLRAALQPAALLALFCGVLALIDWQDGGPVKNQPPLQRFLSDFYRTFALLAPVPSILLANHYARLAAEAHRALGFGQRAPRLQGLWLAAQLALRQLIVVAIAAAPVVGLLRAVPVVGTSLAWLVGGLWALHWIVVEALDSAAVLEDRGHEARGAGGDLADPGLLPWFVRFYAWLAGLSPPGVSFLLRRFASLNEWLSRPWQAEIRVTRRNPALMIGFALTTAALLATPVLNLLFRPIILIAAVHVLGRLSTGAPHQSREPKLPFLPNLSLPGVPREVPRRPERS